MAPRPAAAEPVESGVGYHSFALRYRGDRIPNAHRNSSGRDARYRQEYLSLRERWATLTNDALREANVDARIDHRSLAAQGIDREPRPSIPLMHLKMEQRGLHSQVAEGLRAKYRERVASRLERQAGREGPDAAVRERQAAPSTAVAAGAGADVEEIRRRAREAWLQLRANEPQTNAQSSDREQGNEHEARERDTAAAKSPQDDFAL